MRKIILSIILILVVFLSGCINISDDAEKLVEKVSDELVVCNEPYMRLGNSCCLDINNNAICDKDEAGTDNLPPTEQEDFCNPPYIQVGTECCLDQNGNNICDSDESTTQYDTDVSQLDTDSQTHDGDSSVGDLQLDSVVQLTNYDQKIHRAPEYATISGDGSKIAFFRFIKYVDAEVAYPIRNAVYVANTGGLNTPELVFESGTVPSVMYGNTQYYYSANVRGSTALTDDGKYVYFIVSDSIGSLYLSRVNTATKAFEIIGLHALTGYAETVISNLHIAGNKIYYTAQLVKEGEDTRDWLDTAVFSMNLDGSNQVMLAKTIAGEYPHIYMTSMRHDAATGKLYFEGQLSPNIDAIYYIDNGEFKKVGLSEERGDTAGLVGAYNGEIILLGSGPDFSYNMNSGAVIDFEFDIYPRSFMSNNGNVIFGRIGFSNYNLAAKSKSLIIGHDAEEQKYRDLALGLVNGIIPYFGETVSSDGKTILVQEAKTGFGNYYVIKLN